jgi:hypothetical protein
MISSGFSGKRVVVILFMLVASFGAKAQQGGVNIYSGDSLKVARSKVVLVPFDPILYYSEIDRDLAKTNGLKFEEIRDKFRTNLDLHVGMFLKTQYEVVAPLRDVEEVRKDLNIIYSGIAFNYAALKEEKATGNHKSTRSEIKNGQVVQIDNSGPKYMSTVIKDPKLLTYLNSKYGSTMYVFLTQFEILNDMSDPIAVATGRYSRYVRVHYSILNQDGKSISGGIVKSMIPTDLYDIKKISDSSFRDIGQQIVNAFPVIK